MASVRGTRVYGVGKPQQAVLHRQVGSRNGIDSDLDADTIVVAGEFNHSASFGKAIEIADGKHVLFGQHLLQLRPAGFFGCIDVQKRAAIDILHVFEIADLDAVLIDRSSGHRLQMSGERIASNEADNCGAIGVLRWPLGVFEEIVKKARLDFLFHKPNVAFAVGWRKKGRCQQQRQNNTLCFAYDRHVSLP